MLNVNTALVHGNIPHDYGTVDAPIGRNKNDRQAMAVVDDGKEAVTHFNVIEHFKDYTLIECELKLDELTKFVCI